MKKKKYLFWLLLVIFFGVFFIKEQYMLYNLNNVDAGYKSQLNKLAQQNAELKNQTIIARRKDYIEKQAREKLGLIKPGELLFIDKNKKSE